jgi:hypothetical protein
MRALLVVAALLLAASPAAAKPRAKRVTCAAATKRAHVKTPRACARLHRAGVRRGALSLVGPFTGSTRPAPVPASAPVATPTPTPEPEGPSLPPVYSNPFAVQVQAFEFGLQLSKSKVSAGNVRVEFNLVRAEDPHNLFLVREDGSGPAYSFDEEPSGVVVAKTFPLTGGRWNLFCALPEHEGKGMRATLTVG